MIERIAILGTGLLGTSVGLALRAAGFRGAIAGWNRGAEGGQTALSMGAVDLVAADAIQAARESQVVLLTVPIYATLDWMERLAPVLGPEHLVTDVGSTKVRCCLGRRQPVSRRGMAVYRRPRLEAVASFGGPGQGLAAVGRGDGFKDYRY
jgi:prephenate dehydrogenase